MFLGERSLYVCYFTVYLLEYVKDLFLADMHESYSCSSATTC